MNGYRLVLWCDDCEPGYGCMEHGEWDGGETFSTEALAVEAGDKTVADCAPWRYRVESARPCEKNLDGVSIS